MAKKKPNSPAAKSTRAGSWQRSQDRKAERVLVQEEQAKINKQHRERGERTPAQQRKRDAFMARIGQTSPEIK